jgi:Winged helix-turn-helix DNA-binding
VCGLSLRCGGRRREHNQPRKLTADCRRPYNRATEPMRKIGLTNIQAALSETARDINRRIVLNLIRSRRPTSRADLARFSGLQRSTVSVIVDQLITEGWVVEGPRGCLPRGRRPIHLRLNSQRAIIGIDIRPTKTIVAIAGGGSPDITGCVLCQGRCCPSRCALSASYECLTVRMGSPAE